MNELRNSAASASAMLVGTSVGCLAVGVLYLLGDKSKAINQLLSVYPPSGALSGVLIFGSLIWLICWAVLSKRWMTRPPSVAAAVRTAILLMLLSLLLTFPPFVRLI